MSGGVDRETLATAIAEEIDRHHALDGQGREQWVFRSRSVIDAVDRLGMRMCSREDVKVLEAADEWYDLVVVAPGSKRSLALRAAIKARRGSNP